MTGLLGFEKLMLQQNHFAGVVPAKALHQLEFLREVHAFRCMLTGTLPEGGLRRLQSLVILRLHYNQLSGTLPDYGMSMRSAQDLVVSNNRLQGELPTLRGMPVLEGLDVSNNFLEGSVRHMQPSSKLLALHIQNNTISGMLPESGMVAMLSLAVFAADRNRLSGSLPEM
eukprot:1075566-Amphidinium_carterae.1